MSHKPGTGPERERWARLRFAVVGPLLAAPPEAGGLQAALEQLAARHWQHPVRGTAVQFGVATIERWYYAAKNAGSDPVAALRRAVRCDAGAQRSLSAPLRVQLQAQYQAHPSWTAQLHYDNLETLVAADPELGPLPSYASVRRYLKAHGFFRQSRPPARPTAGTVAAAVRRAGFEIRSYESAYTNALWHADYHHGSRPVLTRTGEWVTPILLGVLDDHSRLACHAQWYLEETAETFVHGVAQALQKRALPRAFLSDNGGPMTAAEVVAGWHELGVVQETTLPYSPYQNGKQERFWATVEGRLLAMLDGYPELTLELLNEATQAWVELEYNRVVHSELGCAPLERYRSGRDVGRECPGSEVLRRAFRMEVTRTQRRSDGTCSLAGRRFEIPARYRHLEALTLRYARWDLTVVDLVDVRSGTRLCALYPLDKTAHASGARRALEPVVTPAPVSPTPTIAPLLRQLMADYAATGLPPAYVPHTPTEPTP
jgi:putative transposase